MIKIGRTAPPAPPTVPAAVPYLTQLDAKKARETIEKINKALRAFTAVVGTAGIGALIFTMINVCLFAIGLGVSSWIAWMLDPIVSITLLGSLLTDGVFSALGLRAGRWDWALRIFAGMATWTMNVWAEIFDPGTLNATHANPAGILLHSVAPALVIIAGEALAFKRRQAAAKIIECEITIRNYEAQCAAERKAARDTAEREAREAREAEERREARQARERSETAEREARERQQEADRKSRERQQEEARKSAERLATLKADTEKQARETAERKAENDRLAAIEQARITAEAGLEAKRLQITAGEQREARERDERLAREARERDEAKAREQEEAQARALEKVREQIAQVWDTAHRENRAFDARKTREAAETEARETIREPRAAASRQPRETPVPAAREDDADAREGVKIQRAQATYEAAKLLVMLELGEIASVPTHAAFAAQWNAKATWGGDRFRDASAKLDRERGDAQYRDAVEMDVMEELTKTSSGNAQ